jgi:ParB-like chromosome segregation protein Spo0J
MKKLTWHTEVRKVKSLKVWSKNPRKLTKSAFSKLVERIKERGFHAVIIIDTDDTILSGNQRKKALLSLGIEEVTVLLPNRKLTKDERKKIALESNINDGEWDFEKLKSFDLDLITDILKKKNYSNSLKNYWKI